MLGYDVASYPLTDNLMQWFVFLVGTKILRRQRIPGISKRHIRVILAPTMTSSLPYRVMRAFVVLFPSGRLCVLTTYNILGAPPNHMKLVAPRDSPLSRTIGKGSMASRIWFSIVRDGR